jgi:hypothetical protein
VGIGTGIPTASLHISGANVANLLRIQSPASSSILFVSGSGNIGMGLTVPAAQLHISGAGASTSLFRVNSGSAIIQNNALQSNRSASVAFFTTTGNPTSNFDFDIQGTGTANGGTARIAGSSTIWLFSSAATVTRTGTGNTEMFGVVMGGTATAISQNPMRVQFDANQSSTAGYVVLRLNATHTAVGSGAKLLQTWEFAGTQLNVVSSSGAMGIGITTPSASLHISGANTANLLRIQSPVSSSILFVSGSGNIGMGLTVPSAQLHISGASNRVLFEIDSPAVNNIIYVSGSGRVGIGTSLPTASFHISGAAVDRLLHVGSPSQANILFVTGSGRVGIGTDTPSALFEVRTSSATKILAEAGGNVGIQTTPSEWIHLSSDPANSKYIQIDAIQFSASPTEQGGSPDTAIGQSANKNKYLTEPDYWIEIKLDAAGPSIVLIPCYIPG